MSIIIEFWRRNKAPNSITIELDQMLARLRQLISFRFFCHCQSIINCSIICNMIVSIDYRPTNDRLQNHIDVYEQLLFTLYHSGWPIPFRYSEKWWHTNHVQWSSSILILNPLYTKYFCPTVRLQSSYAINLVQASLEPLFMPCWPSSSLSFNWLWFTVNPLMRHFIAVKAYSKNGYFLVDFILKPMNIDSSKHLICYSS